jgi:hypothetical protein
VIGKLNHFSETAYLIFGVSMKLKHLRRCLATWSVRLLLGSLVLTNIVLAQSSVSIDETDHRPLAAALDKLQSKTGVVINYEDVPYENAADLEDVSTEQQRAFQPGYRLLVPRKGHIRAAGQVSSTTSLADTVSLLHSLFANYKLNRMPGEFTLEQFNGALYVAPIRFVNASGSSQDVTSPMKSSIDVPYAERRVIDTVELIVKATSQASGKRIDVGTVPFLPSTRVAFGVRGESARSALASLFAQLHSSVSYRLLYDPQDRAYMLNLQITTATAAGSPATGKASGSQTDVSLGSTLST